MPQATCAISHAIAHHRDIERTKWLGFGINWLRNPHLLRHCTVWISRKTGNGGPCACLAGATLCGLLVRPLQLCQPSQVAHQDATTDQDHQSHFPLKRRCVGIWKLQHMEGQTGVTQNVVLLTERGFALERNSKSHTLMSDRTTYTPNHSIIVKITPLRSVSLDKCQCKSERNRRSKRQRLTF